MKPPMMTSASAGLSAYAIDQQGVVDVGQQGAGTVTFRPIPDYPTLSRFYESPAMKATLEEYQRPRARPG